MLIELRDVDSLPLVTALGPDDYVVSDAVGSRFIAQLAEQPARRAVLLALYGDDGPVLRTERAGRLDVTGVRTAADLFAATYEAGAIAVGWMTGPERVLRLNPPASTAIELDPDDLVVLVG